MKKISLGIGLAVLMSSTGALAGYVFQGGVTFGANSASGTVNGTRYSSDSYQQIGCDIYGAPGSPAQGSCWAENSARQWKSCVTTDPALVAAAGTVNATSFISFYVASDNYTCTSIDISNGSADIH